MEDIVLDSFVRPSANSTDYGSVFDDLEASVKRLDSSVSQVEDTMKELRRSEKRSCCFQALFAATLLLLCVSMGYSLYLTVGLKSEVQILRKVRLGNYEEETQVKAKVSFKTGLASEPEATLPAPPIQEELVTSPPTPPARKEPEDTLPAPEGDSPTLPPYRKRYYVPSSSQ